MISTPRSVTVVIPTLGTRTPELQRAVDSILSQRHCDPRIQIVVNGDRYDREYFARASFGRDVQVEYLPFPGVSSARYFGIGNARSPYFAFLDDDDELLPGALATRLDYLEKHDNVDVVVTNGYRQIGGECEPAIKEAPPTGGDLAKAILDCNWLASPGALFRTSRVSKNIFEHLPDYLEMTYLGFVLSLKFNVAFVDTRTFVIHVGRKDHSSGSLNYFLQAPSVILQMQSMTTRKDLKRSLIEKRVAALHDASVRCLTEKKRWMAWLLHAKTVGAPAGWRYLPYTYRLLAECLKPRR